jgi:hypothetical protein
MGKNDRGNTSARISSIDGLVVVVVVVVVIIVVNYN